MIDRSLRFLASLLFKEILLTAWIFFQSARICFKHFTNYLEVLQNAVAQKNLVCFLSLTYH